MFVLQSSLPTKATFLSKNFEPLEDYPRNKIQLNNRQMITFPIIRPNFPAQTVNRWKPTLEGGKGEQLPFTYTLDILETLSLLISAFQGFALFSALYAFGAMTVHSFLYSNVTML